MKRKQPTRPSSNRPTKPKAHRGPAKAPPGKAVARPAPPPARPPPATPPPGLPLAPRAVAAVLLFSPDPAALARFYRGVVGLPMQPIQLPGVEPHFACEVNHVYVGIVPGAATGRREPSACLALYVADVEAGSRALTAAGVPLVSPPRRTPLGLIARFLDPDGNAFELYQP